MSPLYAFEQSIPVVHPTAFVHPQAVLIGNVHVEADCFIGPCASLRGDFGRIVLHAGSNVQDCCVLHAFPGRQLTVGRNGHVGHGAVLHGCTLAADVLIGMNAVVMDGASIGAEAFVSANSLVRAGFQVPERHLAAGSPATVLRQLTDAEVAWKAQGTRVYQELARRCRDSLRPVATTDSAEGRAAANTNEGTSTNTIPTAAWRHVPLDEYKRMP